MDWELLLVIFIVALALGFDFINGFHDAANSVATIVSTRVLTPTQAVIWAAFFNFVAAFGLGIHVANTIGKGIIETSIVDEKRADRRGAGECRTRCDHPRGRRENERFYRHLPDGWLHRRSFPRPSRAASLCSDSPEHGSGCISATAIIVRGCV